MYIPGFPGNIPHIISTINILGSLSVRLCCHSYLSNIYLLSIYLNIGGEGGGVILKFGSGTFFGGILILRDLFNSNQHVNKAIYLPEPQIACFISFSIVFIQHVMYGGLTFRATAREKQL